MVLNGAGWGQELDTPARLGGGGGVFGGLEPLHRYNLHFTEGFLRSSRYKAVTRPLQAVTKLQTEAGTNVLDCQHRIKVSRGRVKRLMFRSVLLYPGQGAWRRMVS